MLNGDRLLLIGQAPNSKDDGCSPCLGRFMHTLCEAAGIERHEYLERCERRNLLSHFPGKDGKGDAFPLGDARIAAESMNIRGRTVVLFGRNVAKAFGSALPFLGFAEHREAAMYLFPHPSGLNRWWNDAGNVRAAGILFRRLVLSGNRRSNG